MGPAIKQGEERSTCACPELADLRLSQISYHGFLPEVSANYFTL